MNTDALQRDSQDRRAFNQASAAAERRRELDQLEIENGDIVYSGNCPLCDKPLPSHPGRYAVVFWPKGPNGQPCHFNCVKDEIRNA